MNAHVPFPTPNHCRDPRRGRIPYPCSLGATVTRSQIPERLAAEFPKACRCCGALIEREEWHTLPCIGSTADPFGRVEYRNHVCGSTLAVLTAIYDLSQEHV